MVCSRSALVPEWTKGAACKAVIRGFESRSAQEQHWCCYVTGIRFRLSQFSTSRVIMLLVSLRVPTLEDAQAAAEILAEAGATRVLLFGSLARGEANELSDIDLVAIFDDLDYTERHQLSHDLNQKIEDQVDIRNDLVVTDHPEWKSRTEGEVPTCFQACISMEVVPLIDGPPLVPVIWDKPLDVPITRLEEAAFYLKDLDKCWYGISSAIEPDTFKAYGDWGISRNYEFYIDHLDYQFRKANGKSHLAVVTCLRLLLTLYCDTPNQDMGKFNTGKLLEHLRRCAPEQAETIETLRGNISHDEISFWYEASMSNIHPPSEKGIYYKASKQHTIDFVCSTERITAHTLQEYKTFMTTPNETQEIIDRIRYKSEIVLKNIESQVIGLAPYSVSLDSNTNNPCKETPLMYLRRSIRAALMASSDGGYC